MFFQANELERFVICDVCERKFEDPRVLPCCGKTFCFNCIDALMEANKLKVKCKNCAKTHDLPREGFPTNIELANILRLEPNEVFRSQLFTDLTSLTNSRVIY